MKTEYRYADKKAAWGKYIELCQIHEDNEDIAFIDFLPKEVIHYVYIVTVNYNTDATVKDTL